MGAPAAGPVGTGRGLSRFRAVNHCPGECIKRFEGAGIPRCRQSSPGFSGAFAGPIRLHPQSGAHLGVTLPSGPDCRTRRTLGRFAHARDAIVDAPHFVGVSLPPAIRRVRGVDDSDRIPRSRPFEHSLGDFPATHEKKVVPRREFRPASPASPPRWRAPGATPPRCAR